MSGLVVVLVACSAIEPIASSSSGLRWRTDDSLVASGFDGLSVPGVGYWIRERVWRQGSDAEEMHHHFALTTGPDPCKTWWVEPPRPPVAPPGTDPVVACGQTRAWYAARAGKESQVDELVFGFALNNTVRGVEPHLSLAPVPGAYTPLDGPDADVIEFTFDGSRVLFDWPAAVAAAMDCASVKPWAEVPSDDLALAEFSASSGTLTLEAPVGDVLPFQLSQVVVVDNGDGSPSAGGVLDGRGVFRACDVDRELRPQVPVEE